MPLAWAPLVMPGTRSSEYAHLAAIPGDSGPDMEREGGLVCVSVSEAGGTRLGWLLPELASPVPPHLHPPSAPPWPLPHPPSSAPFGRFSREAINSITSAWDWQHGVNDRAARLRAIKGVMQRSPSHSRTQPGAHCTALFSRRRPSAPFSPRAGRESLVLARRPDKQPARPRPDPARPPDPGRPERSLEVSAGSQGSERDEGGLPSFPSRPSK